ncbi:hypothetical protein FA13DRAFT_1736018 [Coprinellus micaceus]|uniref:Uncharacterized protein n=1 Tax=Coprinellus micaceus TaxID=71717 RepID=A0A4Y7T2E0_COPMI|nr:hypothetical protein FA13DRAFT_1742440 [Coprinellus micaceus]TEB28118.1 hypothetical protein FA13DRAFT_1736018 [Coprinellus micaceus]
MSRCRRIYTFLFVLQSSRLQLGRNCWLEVQVQNLALRRGHPHSRLALRALPSGGFNADEAVWVDLAANAAGDANIIDWSCPVKADSADRDCGEYGSSGEAGNEESGDGSLHEGYSAGVRVQW